MVDGTVTGHGGIYYDVEAGACAECKAGEYLEPPPSDCVEDDSKCVNPLSCNSCERKEDTYQVPSAFFIFGADAWLLLRTTVS